MIMDKRHPPSFLERAFMMQNHLSPSFYEFTLWNGRVFNHSTMYNLTFTMIHKMFFGRRRINL